MTVIVASNNKKKIVELSAILNDFGIDAITMSEAGLDFEIEENGTSFEENAIIKAKAVWEATKKPSIADDSGLEVMALDDAPGIYSARYAGEGKTDKDRNDLLLHNMKGIEDRQARFVSAIAYYYGEDKYIVCRGDCYGEILEEEKGSGGFGYDPLFYVKEYNMTFAEISGELKNKISHRAVALVKFKNEMEKIINVNK